MYVAPRVRFPILEAKEGMWRYQQRSDENNARWGNAMNTQWASADEQWERFVITTEWSEGVLFECWWYSIKVAILPAPPRPYRKSVSLLRG